MATLIRGIRRLFCLWAAVAAAVAGHAVVPPSEAELKAVFLFNFGSYVQWPESALRPGEPFVIGIHGAPAVADALEKITRGEKIRDRAVEVRQVAAPGDWWQCHIVFIAAGAELRVPWAELNRRPILTVGETAEFDEAGGIVRFLRERNRIKLAIDRDNARTSSLVFSSRLLRLAQVKGER